jgi:Ca-activated chloride channel family protein
MKNSGLCIKFKFLYVLFSILSLGASVFAQDEEEVINVNTSLVVLNAVVTNANGKYVLGLKQGDFKVFEDGKEQAITNFSTEETSYAAAVLIDTSGSMETRMSVARSAAIRFLEGLRTDDVAAIYNFDSKVTQIQDFSPSRDLPNNAYELKAYGMTVLNDAIVQAARDLSNRPETRRAIIVLSDGADTKSGASQDKAIKAALAANATIYTVDMSALDGSPSGRGQNISALKGFAEKSGGRFLSVAGGPALRQAFKQIVEELGAQYTLGYSTEAKPDGKWHNLEIRLSRPTLQVRTRKGFNAPKEKSKK